MSMVTTKIMYLLMIICFNPHTIITHLDKKTENQLPQVHINHLVVANYHQHLVPINIGLNVANNLVSLQPAHVLNLYMPFSALF